MPWKTFIEYLKNDFKAVTYKESRDGWSKAEVVLNAVQSRLFNNKYQSHFALTNFDLVISDEAHRSIGGNSLLLYFFVSSPDEKLALRIGCERAGDFYRAFGWSDVRFELQRVD